MPNSVLRKLTGLDLEEKILNIGSIAAFLGVFMPWAGGEWLGGDSVTYSGFGFYTAYLGIAIFVIHLGILALTISPASGGPALIRKERKDLVRLIAAGQATVLALAALTVIVQTTLDFTRMEIRFGIYVTLIGSMVCTLYAFLCFQERKKREVEQIFHYPAPSASEQPAAPGGIQSHVPPQPPSEPEDHRAFPPPRQ